MDHLSVPLSTCNKVDNSNELSDITIVSDLAPHQINLYTNTKLLSRISPNSQKFMTNVKLPIFIYLSDLARGADTSPSGAEEASSTLLVGSHATSLNAL